MAAAINGKTRMIIVNTPHNPTGAVFDEHDIERLTALTRDTDIVILSDEVYEHVVFDGEIHHSMARYPQLAERSVIVSSFGKTYHVTGWRVGYCLAPAALMDGSARCTNLWCSPPIRRCNTPSPPRSPTRRATGLAAFYQQKRDLLASALQDSRFELLPSRGSFFMLARFSGFSHESDNDFAVRLIREAKVATIPLSAFYSDGTNTGLIRLSFSKDNETLLEGARRLSRA